MSAQYCFACDSIRLVFGKRETTLEYVSNGEVVKTENTLMSLPRDGDTLSLNIKCFVPSDAPKQYSIDDLLKMLREKKEP